MFYFPTLSARLPDHVDSIIPVGHIGDAGNLASKTAGVDRNAETGYDAG
jgi:hypothetical protein